MHSLLLSIRPEHAKKIFIGSKKVELRRVKPKLNQGDTVLIYVSSPTKSLVGGFEVDSIIEGSPEDIWEQVEGIAGINIEEYNKYFDGSKRAYGIAIRNTWSLDNPLGLSELKNRWKNFHPPQSFKYVSFDEAKLLGINEISCRK